MDWPKKPTQWIKDRTLYVSIPFTWNLLEIKEMLQHRSFFWDRAILGGPAIALNSSGFENMEHVSIGPTYPFLLIIIFWLHQKNTLTG